MLNPQIIFNDQKYSYPNTRKFIIKNSDSKDNPSQDIVRQEKIYENRIPKYNIYSGNNKYKTTLKNNEDKILINRKGDEFFTGEHNAGEDWNEIVAKKIPEEEKDDDNDIDLASFFV